MNKQIFMMMTLLAAGTIAGAKPASADVNVTFQVSQPGPVFVGEWYGRHDGQLGWWHVERGHFRRFERARAERGYAWRR